MLAATSLEKGKQNAKIEFLSKTAEQKFFQSVHLANVLCSVFNTSVSADAGIEIRMYGIHC